MDARYEVTCNVVYTLRVVSSTGSTSSEGFASFGLIICTDFSTDIRSCTLMIYAVIN